MKDLRLYTISEAASILGRHRRTILRWVDEGVVEEFFRVRSAILIPAEEVERLKKERGDDKPLDREADFP